MAATVIDLVAAVDTRAPGTAGGARTGRARQVAVQVLGVGLAAGLAWWARGYLVAAGQVMAHSSPWWLLLAAAAEALSMASLAREQRRLVGAGPDGPLPLRSALATTYAGNAISVALPLAGSSLSAAFTFRRYVRAGAPAAQVATGLAVSWAVASSAFAAVLAAAAIATGYGGLVIAGVLASALSVGTVVGLLLVVRSAPARVRLGRLGARVVPVLQRFTHRPAGDPDQLVDTALEQLARARLRPGDISAATVQALLLWTADIACLGFALVAVGSPLAPTRLALAWALGVGANTLSLVPGGIGLVEAALTTALVAAGLPAAEALAGVLVYRLLNFWIVAGVGGAVLMGYRRHGRGEATTRRPPA